MKTSFPRFAKRLAWCGGLMLAAASGFPQIAAWQFGSPASTGSEATYSATTLDANLAPGTALSRGSGISATGLVRAFSANSWDIGANQTAAITNNEYFQFSLGAAAGYQVSLSTLDAKIRRTSSGPNAYLWRYSLDGTTFNDIGTPVSYTGTESDGLVQAQINLSGIAGLQAVQSGTTITMRLYAWGATSLTGTFAVGRYGTGLTTNSLAIGGTVTPGSGPTNTSVEFASSTSGVAENGGTTSLTLSITDPDPVNATSVDVVLVSGDAARINNYTTQTVNFPGGSSADQTVTITVTNNSTCGDDGQLTFELQNITGGQGIAEIGNNNAHVLSITNDDVAADPVTTVASGISESGFTANWDAVPGATGYFLDVSTSPNFGIYTHDTISEGFDGGRNALPSGWTQTGLGTDYTSSGNYGLASPSLKFDDSNDQLVSTTYTGPADSISFWYKGQSTAGSASALLTEGWNGSSWVTIGTLTSIANNAIGTQKYILNPNDGFVQFRFTYTKVTGNLSFDDFNVYYTFGTPDFVPGYQNLSVSGTSQAVVGLDPLTTYYYRVRSTGGCSTGGNSNVTNVTTLAGINPALGASSLADFGNVCLNADGGPGSFTITGSNLTSADVTVGPLAGFTFSTSELGTYVASLSISQPGGSFSQEVWVKFTPTLEQSYNGNIPIGGGGAPSIDASALGEGINTAASMSTVGTSNIGENQVNADGTIDSEGCSSLTEYGIEYSTTQGFTPGTGTQVPSTNEINGAYFSVLSGLSPCTVYYFLAYGTNNGGTSYGAEGTFETSPISAPVATVPVTVNSNDFTATWDAVSGATGYRLDVSTSSSFGNSVPASGLFFSEYVEGGSNNKYVEIFNGTGSTVNLADYALQLFANGTSTPTVSDTLSGTLNNGAVVVYANSGAVAYGGAVVVSGAVNFNGDDAFALVNVTNSTYADIIGTIGEDPGSAWTGAGGRSTSNKTLVRNDNVHGGVTTNPVSGFPTLETEWAVFNQDDVSHLGTHSFNSIIPYFLPGYEDLAVAGTSQSVSGLNTSTTYYYRVRAESASCTSGNSNTMSVTTLACSGNSFVVAINTDANGDQITWEVVDGNNVSVATGGPYTGQNNTLITETVCIGNAPVSACYGFHLYDSFGDGLGGVGNWQLRTTDGKVLLGDDFATGYSSPDFAPA
ncbi:MAG: lamin tail domain-containing protein, partial [Bacteroidetes bacterium]|nr:lamin tail domain-containing protein [Bacteroidota bacterium]